MTVPSNLIPTRITQLPPVPGALSTGSLMVVVQDGITYSTTVGDVQMAPGHRFGQFWSTQDQSLAANTAGVFTFNNSTATNTGITIESDSRATFESAGVYHITCSVQFINAENTEHAAWMWFRKNGVDIPDSASKVAIPKSSVTGAAILQVTIIESFDAGQWLEVAWAVSDADVTAQHVDAQTSPFPAPAIPSVILAIANVA